MAGDSLLKILIEERHRQRELEEDDPEPSSKGSYSNLNLARKPLLSPPPKKSDGLDIKSIIEHDRNYNKNNRDD